MTHLHIPLSALYKMPIRDRKFFIKLHNDDIEKKNNNSSCQRTRTITGEAVNKYAGT